VNIPTQAKNGLEWATRPSFRRRKNGVHGFSKTVQAFPENWTAGTEVLLTALHLASSGAGARGGWVLIKPRPAESCGREQDSRLISGSWWTGGPPKPAFGLSGTVRRSSRGKLSARSKRFNSVFGSAAHCLGDRRRSIERRVSR